MSLSFDTKGEETKLTAAREREEEDIARILSDKYGLGYVDLSLIPIDTDALRTIAEDKARATEAIAFERAGVHLSLAVHNPGNPSLPSLLNDLKNRNFVVKQFLVSRKSIEKGLVRYADFSFATQSKKGTFGISGTSLVAGSTRATSLTELKTELEQAMGEKALDRVSHII